jgi:hypothetical protein
LSRRCRFQHYATLLVVGDFGGIVAACGGTASALFKIPTRRSPCQMVLVTSSFGRWLVTIASRLRAAASPLDNAAAMLTRAARRASRLDPLRNRLSLTRKCADVRRNQLEIVQHSTVTP